jgi:hypothetical protein
MRATFTHAMEKRTASAVPFTTATSLAALGRRTVTEGRKTIVVENSWI